jgi:predicted dehydrogenase
MNAANADLVLGARAAQTYEPRLGFLGLGWIGRMRMAALAATGGARLEVLADSDAAALEEARATAPHARCVSGLDELLEQDLDGIVIATPSAMHADQAIQALERGMAVFCQKPLARTETEARQVMAAARRSDRPLGVDYSYRYLKGMAQLRQGIRQGAIGEVFAAELSFHNAYGPDKAWFRDLRQSGGGCLTDLGTHLLDLALWCLGEPEVQRLQSRLFANGRRLTPPLDQVEDYAALDIDLDSGAHVNVTCSWNLHAGCDVVIGARFFGTQGAFALRNVNGSYFDFVIERMSGTACEALAAYPDDWGGRALQHWVQRLQRGEGFDADDDLARVPRLLDQAYGRGRKTY